MCAIDKNVANALSRNPFSMKKLYFFFAYFLTKLAPSPIQSISGNVRLWVSLFVVLSPLHQAVMVPSPFPLIWRNILLVLLSAHIKLFTVSRMCDFSYSILNWIPLYTLNLLMCSDSTTNTHKNLKYLRNFFSNDNKISYVICHVAPVTCHPSPGNRI